MAVVEQLNIGIVGACGRGFELGRVLCAIPHARVHAVCDVASARLDEVARQLGAAEQYDDYEAMLERAELDAVIVATPMPLHAPQSIVALRSGLHVLSEVPAAVGAAECRALAEACRASGRVYSMAENFNFYRPNVAVAEMVRRGLFGTVYHASADYWDEYKAHNERTPWRRLWQTGINGITYGTHSLGPLLMWMAGDRIVSVCCVGSGHHYRDPRGDYYENEDACVMLGRLRSGGLIVLRHDMTSDRPQAYHVNGLQGTDGCYESSRLLKGYRPAGTNRIWLRSRCPDMETWLDLATIDEEFLPEGYIEQERLAADKGLAFYAYFPVADWVEAIVHSRPPAIGIDEALDMTLPGLVSQESIAQGGAWLPVPDSRDW
ncbi:MAG: Gfo/Idh/MocA family protein [Anaerolineae bacterium]